MRGYHYHNPQGGDFGAAFVARTLLKNLMRDEIALPLEERWEGGPTSFPLKKLGIGHPVLISTQSIAWRNKLEVDDVEEEPEKPANGKDDKAAAGKKAKPVAARPNAPMPGMPAVAGGDQAKKKLIDAPRYDFVVQFCWQVPPPDTMVELVQLYPGAVDPANAAPVPPAPDEAGANAAPAAPAAGPDGVADAPADVERKTPDAGADAAKPAAGNAPAKEEE
ncbi:MAG: hypothetical protein B7Z73_13180 [Planctomycetia bacterium 21-64-5]|nr:MAG: hypothetical protein B7Z73_13180 [Planctomycetia bacterium 21-64-5]